MSLSNSQYKNCWHFFFFPIWWCTNFSFVCDDIYILFLISYEGFVFLKTNTTKNFPRNIVKEWWDCHGDPSTGLDLSAYHWRISLSWYVWYYTYLLTSYRSLFNLHCWWMFFVFSKRWKRGGQEEFVRSSRFFTFHETQREAIILSSNFWIDLAIKHHDYILTESSRSFSFIHCLSFLWYLITSLLELFCKCQVRCWFFVSHFRVNLVSTNNRTCFKGRRS